MIRLMAPLLLLALLPAPSFSSRPIRGVSPSRQSLYSPIPHTSPPRWKCLNSPKEILFEAINDNYCDCEDGSDEPGTSACVGGAFWCANEGHVGAEIKSSRVGDGLCEPECCDGSDEPPGVCPNACESIGAEYRKTQEADRKLRKTGSKIRSTYIAFAQKEKKRLEESIIKLEGELEEEKKEEIRLKDIAEATEALDAAAIAQKKSSPLYETITTHQSMIAQLVTTQESLENRITTLGNILDNLKNGYNPNYQDMAVLEAVRGWEQLKDQNQDTPQAESEGGEDKAEELEEGWTAAEILEVKNKDPLALLVEHGKYLSSPGGDEVSSLLFSIEAYLPDAFVPTYTSLRTSLLSLLTKLHLISPSVATTSEELTRAKSAHSTALSNYHMAQTNLDNEKRALSELFDPKKYGSQGEWKKLDRLCLSKDAGEWTYEVCLFGHATQKSNKDHGRNELGHFDRWDPKDQSKPGELDYYMTSKYTRGAKCWNGPERSVFLELSCGTENVLLSISEPEKCEYLFVGTSPALCIPPDDNGNGKHGDKREEL